MAMTLIAATYRCARVSKAEDEFKNLHTQLLLLAGRAIRSELVYSDMASAANCTLLAGRNW